MGAIGFDEALRIVLAEATRLPGEPVPLAEAAGRVLAEAVVAGRPLPAFDRSAMDGYAAAWGQLVGEGPFRLPIVGESRTGRAPEALAPGTAMRIFTGATMPAGADTVVIQENVVVEGGVAVFGKPARQGANVRRAGEDLGQGTTVLEPGVRLGPGALAAAAAVDRASVMVARRPSVTILCTGDELRDPGAPGSLHAIADSNGIALAELARAAGAQVTVAPRAPDDLRAISERLRIAVATSDVVVTVGGASAGDHDLVRPALESLGGTVSFHRIRMKPGKPVLWGRVGVTRVLGLPGNPVSAQVTFALLAVPLLRAMQGDAKPVRPLRRARLAGRIVHTAGRRGFYLAQLDGEVVTPLEQQSSGSPVHMAWANALVDIPEAGGTFEPGSLVDVRVLDHA